MEIGTASGVSTALIAHATTGTVVTYDAQETFYNDRTKRVGEAARAILPPEVLDRVIFSKAPEILLGVPNVA